MARMDGLQKWSVLLLLLLAFISGSLALTCYSCAWDVAGITGSDENCVSIVPEETATAVCDGADDECEMSVTYALYSPATVVRRCSNSCVENRNIYLGSGEMTQCCNSDDLCNAQDGAVSVAVSMTAITMTTMLAYLVSF